MPLARSGSSFWRDSLCLSSDALRRILAGDLSGNLAACKGAGSMMGRLFHCAAGSRDREKREDTEPMDLAGNCREHRLRFLF